MAKQNASFTLTSTLVFPQGIHTRKENMNCYMLRCYSKLTYVSSPHTRHTTLNFIRCTLHLQSGKPTYTATYTGTAGHSGIITHCTAHCHLVNESSHAFGEYRVSTLTPVSRQISLHIHTATPQCLQRTGQPSWNHIQLLHTQRHRQMRQNPENTIIRQYVLCRVCPQQTTNTANRL